MVARGRAGDALLDTYAAERRPVALRNCEHSVHNATNLASVDAAVGTSFLAPVDLGAVARPPSPAADHGIEGDSPDAAGKRHLPRAPGPRAEGFGGDEVL